MYEQHFRAYKVYKVLFLFYSSFITKNQKVTITSLYFI